MCRNLEINRSEITTNRSLSHLSALFATPINELSREVVVAQTRYGLPFPEGAHEQVDGAEQPGLVEGFLFMEGGLEIRDLKGPFQP